MLRRHLPEMRKLMLMHSAIHGLGGMVTLPANAENFTFRSCRIRKNKMSHSEILHRRPARAMQTVATVLKFTAKA